MSKCCWTTRNNLTACVACVVADARGGNGRLALLLGHAGNRLKTISALAAVAAEAQPDRVWLKGHRRRLPARRAGEVAAILFGAARRRDGGRCAAGLPGRGRPRARRCNGPSRRPAGAADPRAERRDAVVACWIACRPRAGARASGCRKTEPARLEWRTPAPSRPMPDHRSPTCRHRRTSR